MARVRFDIDQDLLSRLYVEEGYSLRKLQGVFHIKGEDIRETLNSLGLTLDMRSTKNDHINKGGFVLTDYEVFFNRIKKEYIWSSSTRDLEFDLNDDEFKDLISGECHYCGIEPSQIRIIKERNNIEFKFNGIDRVNNHIGYTIENTVSCCKTCNLSKNNMDVNEFYDWIDRVYNHSVGGEKKHGIHSKSNPST